MDPRQVGGTSVTPFCLLVDNFSLRPALKSSYSLHMENADDKAADLRPWQGQFEVNNVTVVAETPELRVLELTLEPGECVPWHAHPSNADIFYCIEGVIDVHEKMPETAVRLDVGATHTVPERRAHLVHNPSNARARFLINLANASR